MRYLTFGSLFSGIGGIDLGFERAGMKCIWQCEIEPYCRKVLAKHWPQVTCHDDVRTIDSSFVRPDVLCGGFPCQDISFAGKGAGLGGARSGLFYEFLRCVILFMPKYVVIENVPALRSRGLDTILRCFTSVGYDTEWHCIPASLVGAPHRRDRLWVISYPHSVGTQIQDQRVISAEQIARCFSETRGISGGPRQPWATEPGVGRVADGIPARLDRLRCLGNAVVPQVAELIARAIVAWEGAVPVDDSRKIAQSGE